MKRLAKMLLGTLLAVLALLIPAAPANADDDYMVELTIDDDLNVREIMNVTIPDDSFKLMGNFDFCEQLENLAKVRMADAPGISNPELGNCKQQENNISFEITGKVKEDFTSGEGWKVTDEEIVYSLPREVGMFSGLIDNSEGGVKITFPGKIKSVEPNIGTISGNSWSIDDANNIDSQVTITAERHGSSLGSILGIAIPLVLIIVAVVVAALVIKNRKNKQDSNQSMPGYGAYPPPPVPGNPAVPQAPDRLRTKPNLPGTINSAGTPPTMPIAQPPAPSSTETPENRPSAPGTAGMFPEHPPVTGTAQPPTPAVSPQNEYPPQYGYFPAPPAMPGYPAQPPMPGYPAVPGASGMPGGTPYPPNVPPRAQPGAPMPGGYYPYPYPYTPANSQNPGGGQPSMPNQGYDAPIPGFPPPQTPPTPSQPTFSPKPAQYPRQENEKKPGLNEQENPYT